MGGRALAKTLGAVLAAAAVAIPHVASAQDLQPAATDSGDTAWLLVSSALVMMMVLPGLSLFYGGLVRARNVLSATVQVGAIAAIASILWVLVGYTLAFGYVSNGILGAGNALLLNVLGTVREDTAVPESAFALFQMTFAAITPALMVGAWVERARFGWVLAFCALWGLMVYAPVAHWIWGGGWLATTIGTADFAGGIVVHTTAGISALVVALLIGKRQGFPRQAALPHASVLTMTGAALLWVGWFGFNGGSAIAANDDAASAIIATHVAAACAALAWIAIERLILGKPTAIGFATGAVAGLATITPAAAYVSPTGAIAMGLIGAGTCYAMIRLIKHRLEIDDSLDVFAVHGVAGITGSILLAVFAAPALGGTGFPLKSSIISQLAAQVIGVGVVAVWSAIISAVIAVIVSMVLPMRVGEEAEHDGLDLHSHGERGWEFE